MVLNLDHPDLVLVEDLASTESHMVSLQFQGFKLKWASLGAHSSLNLFINALELYKLRTTSLLTEDAIAMIEAFDLTFELLLTDGMPFLVGASALFCASDAARLGSPTVQTMTMQTEPIHCAMSLPDMKLLWHVLGGWFAPPPDPYFVAPPKPPKQTVPLALMFVHVHARMC